MTLQGHDSFLLVIKESEYIVCHFVVDGVEPCGKKNAEAAALAESGKSPFWFRAPSLSDSCDKFC